MTNKFDISKKTNMLLKCNQFGEDNKLENEQKLNDSMSYDLLNK